MNEQEFRKRDDTGEKPKKIIDDGGTVFPYREFLHYRSASPHTHGERGPFYPEPVYGPERPGMTMRQWYAGKALQGILAARGEYAFDLPQSQRFFARTALEMADALIAIEREERGES